MFSEKTIPVIINGEKSTFKTLDIFDQNNKIPNPLSGFMRPLAIALIVIIFAFFILVSI